MTHRNTIYSIVITLLIASSIFMPHDVDAAKEKVRHTRIVPVVFDEQTIYPSTYATLTMKWYRAYFWKTVSIPVGWENPDYYIEIWDHENHIVPGFAAQHITGTTFDISSIDATRYPKIRVVIFAPQEVPAPKIPARPVFHYAVQPNVRLFIFGVALSVMMLVLLASGMVMRITPLELLRETIMLLRCYPPELRGRQIVIYCWITVLSAGMFGVSLGTFIGGIQLVYLFLKIPFLLLGALLLTIITNAMLTFLLGIATSLRHVAVDTFAVIATIAISLASFVPVIMFFILYPTEHDAMLVVAVAVFVLSACGGAFRLFAYFRQKTTYFLAVAAIGCWVVVYGAVIMQLGWMLRPWVGVRDPVTNSVPFSRLYSGNVIVEMLHTLQRF